MIPIVTTDESPPWVVDLLRVAVAIAELGPIRASFSLDGGCHLDGRSGVAPAEVIAAAEKRRQQKAAKAGVKVPKAPPLSERSTPSQ